MRKIAFVFFTLIFFGCRSPRSENDRPVIQMNKVIEQEEARVRDSLNRKSIPVVSHKPMTQGDSLYSF